MARKGKQSSGEPSCAFCGKREEQVVTLIAGPGVNICDECVRQCSRIVNEGLASHLYEDLVNDLSHYTVALRPDEDRPEWWAGAPSVVRAGDGTYYMAARMREGRSPKGQRGYEIRILQSDNGVNFEAIHHITKEAAGVPGFERSALVIDPESGAFRLYNCTLVDGYWSVIRFADVNHPAQLDPKSWHAVIRQEPAAHDYIRVTGFKDPFIFHHKEEWHCFAIGLDRVERTYHFTSDEGEMWRIEGGVPAFDNGGWHNLFTRPACVLSLGFGWLLVYEGSNVLWHDPNYNIATGLAFTPDLRSFYDLTSEAPLLISDTPSKYFTWRYSHWMHDRGLLRVYWEAAHSDGTNEIRTATIQSFK